MNTKKLLRLRTLSERTIKILDLVKEGKNLQEILQEFANNNEVVQRQLIEYYLKILK